MRSVSDAERHAPNAALAAATAASTSPADANATRLVTRPVAGSNTSPVRADGPSKRFPSIQCETSGRPSGVTFSSLAHRLGAGDRAIGQGLLRGVGDASGSAGGWRGLVGPGLQYRAGRGGVAACGVGEADDRAGSPAFVRGGAGGDRRVLGEQRLRPVGEQLDRAVTGAGIGARCRQRRCLVRGEVDHGRERVHVCVAGRDDRRLLGLRRRRRVGHGRVRAIVGTGAGARSRERRPLAAP